MATGDPAREGESEPEAASSTAVTWHLVAHTVKQAARTGNRFRAQGKVSCHQGIRTQLQGIWTHAQGICDYSSGSATATAPDRLFGPRRTGAGFLE